MYAHAADVTTLKPLDTNYSLLQTAVILITELQWSATTLKPFTWAGGFDRLAQQIALCDICRSQPG